MGVIDDLRQIAPPQHFRPMSHPEQLWRASLLHDCPRKQLLVASGIDLSKSDGLLRKLSMRSGAHDNVQQWLQDCLQGRYDDLVMELPIYDPETRCGGHVDAIVKADGASYVIEIKTYAFLRGDPSENSYWKHQISFYYNTLQAETVVIPLVMIVTLEGQVRVVEPAVTTDYRGILSGLNVAWETGLLPAYNDCRRDDCKKCPLQQICTEPVDTVQGFAEMVAQRSIADG